MVKCTSERIAEELAEEIRSGMLCAGAALPSVDALRARFGAGEYAVRRAAGGARRCSWSTRLTGRWTSCR